MGKLPQWPKADPATCSGRFETALGGFVGLDLCWGRTKNDPALQIKLDEAIRNPIPVKRGPKSIKRK